MIKIGKAFMYSSLFFLYKLKNLFLVLIISFFTFSIIYAQNWSINIETLTKEQLSNKEVQNQIFNIADSLAKIKKEKEAIEYYDKALPFIEDESKKAQILTHKGICLFYLSKYTEIVNSIQMPIKYYEQNNDSANLPEVYNLMGATYLRLGKVDSASFYIYKALPIVENNGSLSEKADVYISLGSINLKLKEYRKALSFHLKCAEMDLSVGDSAYLADDYNAIGADYYLMKNMDSSEIYYNKALDLYGEINSEYGIASTYDGLGKVYNSKGDYDNAFFYLKKALNYNLDKGYKSQAAINLNNISSIYSSMKNYPEAIRCLNKALKINKELKYKSSIADNLLNLSTYYAKSGDYKNAFKFKDKYEKLHDSILNEDLNNKVAAFEIKYKTAQKDREIALQNLELEKQQLRISQQKTRQNLFIAGIILLILLIGFVVFWFMQKKKYREELHYRKLEEQKREEQLKAIKQSLEAGEQERIRLADQLHDDVAPLLIGLRNSIADIGKKFPDIPLFQKITKNISVVHSELRNISHVLYPFSVSGENFADSVNNYIQKFKHANNIEVTYISSEPESINQIPQEIQNFTYRTMQELLNNVVKHANASEINLNIDQKDGMLNLSIYDNGIGIGETEKSDGIGLRRIRKGLEVFEGNMLITNLKTNGVEVKIEIPFSDKIMSF